MPTNHSAALMRGGRGAGAPVPSGSALSAASAHLGHKATAPAETSHPPARPVARHRRKGGVRVTAVLSDEDRFHPVGVPAQGRRGGGGVVAEGEVDGWPQKCVKSKTLHWKMRTEVR